MKTKLKKLFSSRIAYWLGIIIFGAILGVSLQFVKAWTEPTAAPPGGNVGAPINTSANAQTKSGNLNVSGGYIQAYNSSTGNYGLLNYSGYGGYFNGSGGVYSSNPYTYTYLDYPGSGWGVYTGGWIYAGGDVQAGGNIYASGYVHTASGIEFPNGTVQTTAANGFGGMYTVWFNNGQCLAANPYTGSCSCPSDFPQAYNMQLACSAGGGGTPWAGCGSSILYLCVK